MSRDSQHRPLLDQALDSTIEDGWLVVDEPPSSVSTTTSQTQTTGAVTPPPAISISIDATPSRSAPTGEGPATIPSATGGTFLGFDLSPTVGPALSTSPTSKFSLSGYPIASKILKKIDSAASAKGYSLTGPTPAKFHHETLSGSADNIMDSFELLPDVKKENDVLLRSPMYDGVVDPHMNVLWKNIPIPGDCAGAKSRLKVVIRKGVPDTYRREVWTAITQCTEALASSSCRPYREKLASVFGSAITAPPKISDPPTFCGNLDPKCHYVTDDGIEAAKRILVLIAMDHPDIQCCPAIPDCVLLLLTFLTEHEVYLAMRYMIAVSVKSRLYFNVVAQHSSSFLSAFGSLVRKKLPKVTKMMLLAGVDLDFVAMTWFNSLFVGHLPFHTVLRMFDVFLNEGSKILLRVGLGVLSLSQPYLENIVDQAEFIQRLATVAISQVDADVLMKTAFKFKLSRGSYISSSIDAMAKLGGGPPASTSKTPASFVYYMPRIDFVSTVVSSEMFERLWSFLPQRFAIMDPVRLFCADADGFSLPTLIHRSMKSEPLLLALKAKGQVFGVYMSRSFSNLKKNQISGDGETFLWSLTPTPGKYEWTRADELFVFYDNKTLSFGIHGNATGLWLENELSGGSQSSPTYNNPPLCITTTGTGTPTYASRALSTTTGDRRRMEEYEFECTAAEVFTFM